MTADGLWAFGDPVLCQRELISVVRGSHAAPAPWLYVAFYEAASRVNSCVRSSLIQFSRGSVSLLFAL